MIGDLESCNVMSDGLCTTHNQDGRLCRKQAVDEWDRLRLANEDLKLQNDEWREMAAQLAQRLHDVSGHAASIQLCEAALCHETAHKLGIALKPVEEKDPKCCCTPQLCGDCWIHGSGAGHGNCDHKYAKNPERGPGSYCTECAEPWLPDTGKPFHVEGQPGEVCGPCGVVHPVAEKRVEGS